MTITKLLNAFSRLFSRRWDRYFVIEELDDGIETTEAEVNNEEKKINIIKQKFLGKFDEIKKPLIPIKNLVLALSPSQATTIQSLISLKRGNALEPLKEADLDSMVFRGFWEFLNRYRSSAAKKMNISDAEIVLANIEIRDIRLEQYKVFNPLGFKGKKLTLAFTGTFVPRSVLQLIKKVQGWTKNLFLIEGLSIVSTALPGLKNYTIHPQAKKTSIFSLGEENMHYKDLPWGTSLVVENIAKNLSVDYDVSKVILERYIEGGCSQKFARFIETDIRDSLRSLSQMLPQNLKKYYYHFRLPLVKTNLVNFKNWLEGKDYEITINNVKSYKNYDTTLVYLTHNYFLPHYQFLNQLLKRRSKWLITNT